MEKGSRGKREKKKWRRKRIDEVGKEEEGEKANENGEKMRR